MVTPALLLLLMLTPGWQTASNGVIEGTVMNATRQVAEASGVDVVLRAEIEGQLAVVEQTTTDANGRFRFCDLPVSTELVYLPGANAGDVHYPGTRIRLDPNRPTVETQIAVFDTVESPCPLVVSEHRITIETLPGSWVVRETMQIDNDSQTCYVGSAIHAGAMPVTLSLGIPAEFQRVTFDKESWGRQFHSIDDQLVTNLPWPPGQREIGFTYTIPDAEGLQAWRRRLTLPCRQLTVAVKSDDATKVRCNLARATADTNDVVLFQSVRETLSPGFVIELELGDRPRSWIVTARRGALLLLAGLAVVALATILPARNRGPIAQPRESHRTRTQ